MSNALAEEWTPEELAAYRHVEARHDELSARITATTADVVGHAADLVPDLVLHLLGALHDGGERDTGAPGAVVAFIDEALAVLHDIRAEASQEKRRRMDGAMQRSAKLLGIEDEEGQR